MGRPAVVLLFLCLGVALGITLVLTAPEPQTADPIEWLDNPRSVGSFRLAGEADWFDNKSFEGRWTVVLFGFLRCPDICPTSLAQMASLAESLEGQQVSFVFVSVDPGRDTVAALGEYVRAFDPSIRGVTGSEAQLKQLARGLGMQFKVSPGEDDYAVAHSITYSIIDPQGVLRGRFRPGFDVPGVAAEFATKVSG